MNRNEFDIIRDYFSTPELSLEQEGLELGIGDDAALIQIPNANSLSISTMCWLKAFIFRQMPIRLKSLRELSQLI